MTKKKFKERMQEINQKASQVFIAMKKPETPWYAKAMAFLTIAYALSPIDLIPDFIPVLGYLDDIVILPLMITACIKLIPKDIWETSQEEAKMIWKDGKPVKWYFAIPIVLIWSAILFFIVKLIFFPN